MTAFKVKLSSVSYLGLAVETTLGTPVASTAFLPLTSFKPQDNPKFIADMGYRGQAVDTFGQYLGVISSEYDMSGLVYPTSVGNLLAGIFGKETLTGSATPYTHAFTMNSAGTTQSYTLGDQYVAGYRQFAGTRFDKLSFKFTPDAGLTHTTHGIGFPSVVATAPVSQTFATDAPYIGSEAALTLGGSANAKLQSLTLDIQRAHSEALFSASNSTSPYDVFVGPLEATWNMTLFMTDDTEYLYGIQQGTKAVSVVFTQPGTSDTLTLTSSAVQFTKATIDRGQRYVQVQLVGSSIYNATDSGVLQATLVNEISTNYTTTAAS